MTTTMWDRREAFHQSHIVEAATPATAPFTEMMRRMGDMGMHGRSAEAAMQGAGVALAPASMLGRAIDDGSLVRPFALEVTTGRYWLTWLKSRVPSPAMTAFREWIANA